MRKRLSVKNLRLTCDGKVVELKFARRREKRGSPPTRRMFCTRHETLLNSDFGIQVLNFKRPTQSPPYNAEKYGLVTVWDILLQDWRNIPADSCAVIQAIEPDEKNKFRGFIKYFDTHIKKMTPGQKKKFMNI